MSKNFYKILGSMLFVFNVSAQICDINISTTSNLSSCSSLNTNLTIDNANYFIPGADYSFNFNSGSMPSGWSVSGSASFSTPCGIGPDGNYYWASSSGSVTPEIQTKPLDVCSGGTITFDLKYAIQSQSSPCEGPDLETEGVSIEYSIDNGSTWTEFKYFRPDGTILNNIPSTSTNSVPSGATTPFTDWANYTVIIPNGAISTSTKFRWIQYNSSGSAYDNWGLDNITVNAGPCIPSQTIWSTGEINVNNINEDITSNQCYIAGIYDLSNNLICESNEICFEVLDLPTLSVSTPSICVNEMSTIEAIVSPQSIYDYTWTVPSGVSDPGNVSSFTSNIAGTYTVSISNSNLFCNSDFEDDNITSAGSYSTVNQSSVSCWSTTASNSLIEVWGNGYNGVPAYSGIQFIELNATQLSSIYQDFTVVPGSSVSISFAHRGRNGTDVLSVEIGPIGGPYDNLGSFSAGNTAWEYNSVNYTFPDNGVSNYTLRFNSVSAAGGATMGNFLDAISIVNLSCLPSPASSTLVVSDIDITNPGNQTVCDSYTLPTITGTNLSGNESYYDDSQANGGIIIAGPITSTQTVWIYDTNGSCSDEESFLVTVNQTPVITNPGDQTVCDSYTLPTITGSNLSGNENFYDDTQANGGQIITGPLTSSQTVWIYDANGACSDEISFNVTINLSPSISNNPGALTVCAPYTLPTITGTNLSGNENYYDDSQANGGQVLTGPLNNSQTIWIFDSNNGCSDEESYALTVDNTPPTINNPGDQSACNTFSLPIISGTNLSGNENYYDDSQANGGQILSGPITSTQTIWMYDQNGTCSCEESFIVTINTTPSITTPGNQTVCDSYSLSVITGSNLSSTENYYDNSQANGGNIIAGPITSSQTIWIYDNNGNCSDEISFDITINYTPSLNTPSDVTICDSYVFSNITGTNLSGNENFYDNSQANGGAIINGPITSSQTVWIYDADGSCTDETSFDVTINLTPSISNPGNQIICDSYSLPSITGTNLSGNENFYDDTQVNGGNIINSTITSTQTIWLYDQIGNCTYESSFDITINTTPTIDFTVDTSSGCLPLTVKFLNNSTPQFDQVNWDFGDGYTFNSTTEIDSVSHIFNTDNCFDIKLIASANGCVDSLTKASLICVHPKANAEFTVDTYSKTVSNPFFEFNNLSTNANVYYWDFDDDETSIETDPQHKFPNDPRKYYITLIANNAFNCSDTTGQFIELKDELIYYIPNAFTPNNDEFNNTFKPVFYSGYEIEDYTMYIYNRWGQLIFESHDTAVGWNGRYGGNEGEYCPDEMYVWKIHFKETTTDKENNISGHLILYK